MLSYSTFPQCEMSLMADCVAKVESCRARIFAKNLNREAIADSYNLNRAAEVAYEFNVRR